MPRKLTRNDFVERAVNIHKGKYDYSKVEYHDSHTKVCIICPKHGEFWQKPCSHINAKQGCQKCYEETRGVVRRLGKPMFTSRAKEVHGDRYDYSKVEYVNSETKVCIICPIHGEFWQRPSDHLKGCGCVKCGYLKNKQLCQGVGLNDISDECFSSPAYREWYNMIVRCYSKSKPSNYKDCTVDKRWHLYSNFKPWFDEHYVEGWQLDKDVLFKGNRIYSPDACCFVPQDINGLITRHKKAQGMPSGVKKTGYKNTRYTASISKYGRKIYLGVFDCIEEAFNAYRCVKEKHIKELADKYKDRLESRVYQALYNYKVEITD